MSGTKNANNFKVIEAGDMSSNIIGDKTTVKHLDNIGVHLIFTGVPVGTFNIQGSNDTADVKSWVPLDFGTPITAAGAADGHLATIPLFPFMFIRTIYTATSGTGSLDVFISTKEL